MYVIAQWTSKSHCWPNPKKGIATKQAEGFINFLCMFDEGNETVHSDIITGSSSKIIPTPEIGRQFKPGVILLITMATSEGLCPLSQMITCVRFISPYADFGNIP